MGTIIVIAILVGIMVVTRPMRRELNGDNVAKKDKKLDLYELEGYLQLGVGFVVVLMLLAAFLGISDYAFYFYIRVATSVVMLILSYQLLKYRLKPSLLLLSFIITLILFNPIDRVVMLRNEWILVDLTVALALPALTYLHIKKQRGLKNQQILHKKA